MDQQPKATIVFFCFDALGHIHPILSVIKELVKRKYRAVLFTARPLSMQDKFKAQGFELHCCSEQKVKEADADSEKLLRTVMGSVMETFRNGLPGTYQSTYTIDGACGKHMQFIIDNHDEIEAKLKSLKPDLIVFDHIIGAPCATTVAPRWIRVYSGFPSAIFSANNDKVVAGLGLKPSEMTAEMKQFEHNCKGPLREKIRRFWAEKGLEDWPQKLDLVPPSPYLNIYFGIDELSLDKIFEPLPNVWTRFEHTIDEDDLDKVEKEFVVPESIAKLPGKLIYFSMGTLVTVDTDLINKLLKMMSKSPNKFIVSKGQMHEHIKLYPNMWGEKFLDQRAILSKADLFITHGGHNSIIEAFYYGVGGLIVLPVFADQFDSAQRVEDCGLGVRLNPFKCKEAELLDGIDLLLSNKELSARMSAISSRMRSNRYHQKMADKVEEVLSMELMVNGR